MEWAVDRYDREARDQALAAVSIEEPWSLIERFATLVRESGSEDERTAAEYLRERLAACGLPPEVYLPDLYLSVPRSASLSVLEPDPAELECKVPAFVTSTEGGALEGELVEVSTGRVRDQSELFTAEASSDLTKVLGKIVLADGYAMPKIVHQLEEAGAAGAVFINPGHAHEGIITSIWGTPGLSDRDRIPDFVAISVPADVGDQLRQRVSTGYCSVSIQTDLFQGWAPCPVVVADVPGQTDEYVLIHGHYDSWHEGIGDNAVGNAALLEVARVAWQVRERLRRGVRIAWWPGHSTGRYAGSTWFADEFAMDLRDRCVAQIDVDSPGCRWATAYEQVMWMAESEDLARAAIRDAAGAEARGMRPLRAGDYSFNQIGLTGFFMLLSNIPEELAGEKGFYPVGGCGGNSDAWHTEGDLLEVADRENLERDIRVYVDAVTRLATAPLLPFDYRRTVREIVATAAGYGEAAAGNLDVGPILDAGADLLDDLDGFYEDARTTAAGNEDDGSAFAALRGHDRMQLSLARELVPVNYATRRYFHDPALETPPVPDLAVLRDWERLAGDPDGRAFLLAQALRGRNRVTDALKRARERLADFAGRRA